METMKAYRLHSYGGPDSITLDDDVPVPTPGPSEVLISVSVVAVQPFDWKIRQGWVKDEFDPELPIIMGVDIVGTVAAAGSDVKTFKVGDRIMTFTPVLGAWGEYAVVPEAILSRVPTGLSDVEAGTLPMPATTAWETLHQAGNLHPDMRILIHGASGTCGAFAIQLAKAAGAYVIGTASAKNREYVMSLGADEFIDYKTEAFEEKVRDIDLILDYVHIGGAMNTTERSWKVLKPNGAISSASDPSVLAKVPDGFRAYFVPTMPNAAVLERLGEQVAHAELKSKVAKVFPRSGLLEALSLNEAGGGTGRLLVDFKKA